MRDFSRREKEKKKEGEEKERRQKTFLSTKEHRYSPPLPLFCCLRIFPSGPYIMFFSIVFLARREYRVPQRGNLSFCSTANRLMPEIYRQWWSCLHVDKLDFSIITYFPFFFFFRFFLFFFFYFFIDGQLIGPLRDWNDDGRRDDVSLKN